VVTETEIDGLGPGRQLDVMVESKVMGRKVKQVKGDACAWDGEGRAIMHGRDEYILEDYNPAVDGEPIPKMFDPKRVFDYSNYDLGMTRVMDRMIAGPGLHEIGLSYVTSTPGWVASVKWFDPEAKRVRIVHGHDGKYARLAVYRACLKAILT